MLQENRRFHSTWDERFCTLQEMQEVRWQVFQMLIVNSVLFRNFIDIHNTYIGWAKSQRANDCLNSSVTECPIEIILSGMTYYHHWFEEFVKSYSCSFFSNEGSFLHLFDSLDSRIELNFTELCLAIRITFVLKKLEL